MNSIFSLYIAFNRNSKINFVRRYQKGLPKRHWLFDFCVKVRGEGSMDYTNNFTPGQVKPGADHFCLSSNSS